MPIIENLTNPGQSPIDGDMIKETFENGTVIESQYQDSLTTPLIDAKIACLSQIKTEANDRISAFDWKITKAQEQLALGIITQVVLEVIYQERQDIRDASNVAEAVVSTLTTTQEIIDFTW